MLAQADNVAPLTHAAESAPHRTLPEALAEHEQAWNERPSLRRLYGEWFRLVGARLSPCEGLSVELGAGIARFQELFPSVLATDVEPTIWAQQVVDAEALPWRNGEVANLVLIDVFHHLARPAAFLDEARRVLRPAGRVLILDPFCSPVSTFAYRRFHHERTDLDASGLEDDPTLAGSPLESNQARATLAFFRHGREIERRWPDLRIVERRRLALLVYPLVGGFSRRQLLPDRAYWLLRRLERLLAPLAPLAAFRCLVVLERMD